LRQFAVDFAFSKSAISILHGDCGVVMTLTPYYNSIDLYDVLFTSQSCYFCIRPSASGLGGISIEWNRPAGSRKHSMKKGSPTGQFAQTGLAPTGLTTGFAVFKLRLPSQEG
jgi:hypothetical protein